MLAVENARFLLERGHDALLAAKTAVQIMEDFPLFNAGHGSALCADGTVQMSAALMRGSDRRIGAVAGIKTVKHPIIAALTVFNCSQALLIGPHADRHALECDAERRLNDYFITERQVRRRRDQTRTDDPGGVGAVCLDTHGVLAAASSTGGMSGQPAGRVAGTALIGAGTWADERVAVSFTGDDEGFIRSGAATRLATLVECGTPLAEAADRVLANLTTLGGRAGLIAVDAEGNVVAPSTGEMPLNAIWHAGSRPNVASSRRADAD